MNLTANDTYQFPRMSEETAQEVESDWAKVVSSLCSIAAQGLFGDNAEEAEVRCRADAEARRWRFRPIFDLQANLSADVGGGPSQEGGLGDGDTPPPGPAVAPPLAPPVGNRIPTLSKPGAGGFPRLVTGMSREARLHTLMEMALHENMVLDSARFTDRAVTQLHGRMHPMTYGLAEEYRTRQPLSIIYQKQPFHWQWHLDQHLVMLQRPVKIVLDPPSTRYQDNSIVVVNHLSFQKATKYFAELVRRGNHRVAAFHLGDIEFKQNYAWYNQVKFVMRNHYPARHVALKRNIPLKHTYILPLGSLVHDSMTYVNHGEFNRMIPASRRKHLCNFIGNLGNHPNRQALAKGLEKSGMGPNAKEFHYKHWGADGGVKCLTFYSGADWKSKKQMQPYEYRAVIQDSAFTFAPQGRGPSSFRLSEALEFGSIPILSDIDTVHLPYGEHPLPVIANDEWETAPTELMQMYAEFPEKMDELQRRVFTWWRSWKKTYQANLACLIERDVMQSQTARDSCLTPAQFGGYAISEDEAKLLRSRNLQP